MDSRCGQKRTLPRLYFRDPGQLRLGAANLDVLAAQLTGALDAPLLLYLSSAALAQSPAQVSERLGRGWADLVRRVMREA
jgi:polyketide synthase 12